MKVSYSKGIHIEYNGGRIILDPETTKVPSGIPTISTHAHSDHIQALLSSAISHTTKETLALFKAANPHKGRNYEIREQNEPFELNGFEIELIPAGHLLGASQVLVRAGPHTLHYTGDFCPEQLYTAPAATIPRDVDLTIIDSTYGDSNILFDSRSASRTKLFLWIMQELKKGAIPILYAGKMGATQEIIIHLNKMAPNLQIYIHPDLKTISDTYVELGVNLKYTVLEQVLNNEKAVIIAPRDLKTDIAELDTFKKQLRRCMVSGQSAKFAFSKFDYAVPLSTHASYMELVDTVEKIAPQKVLTAFGYHEKFAQSLNAHMEQHSFAEPLKRIEILDLRTLEVRKKPQDTGLDAWF